MTKINEGQSHGFQSQDKSLAFDYAHQMVSQSLQPSLKDSSAIESFTGLKFPRDKIAHALFAGKEREGPFRNYKTLFVVGDVPFDEIWARYQEVDRPYRQIYFGAGGRFDHNPDTVSRVIENLDSYKTHVVVENPEVNAKLIHLWPNIVWMLPIVWHGQSIPSVMEALPDLYNDDTMVDKILVKIDTGSAVLVNWLENFVASDYKDYGADVLLMQKEIQR